MWQLKPSLTSPYTSPHIVCRLTPRASKYMCVHLCKHTVFRHFEVIFQETHYLPWDLYSSCYLNKQTNKKNLFIWSTLLVSFIQGEDKVVYELHKAALSSPSLPSHLLLQNLVYFFTYKFYLIAIISLLSFDSASPHPH